MFSIAKKFILTGVNGALIALCLIVLFSQPAASQAVLRVTNHNGGSVAEMAQNVRDLSARGTQVRIGPGRCMSSCTMLLGARNVCVYADTEFGFHGPTSPYYGVGLPPAAFERWSQVMARHYPKPLHDWFLTTGRHKLMGVYTIMGRDLIALGVPQCT